MNFGESTQRLNWLFTADQLVSGVDHDGHKIAPKAALEPAHRWRPAPPRSRLQRKQREDNRQRSLDALQQVRFRCLQAMSLAPAAAAAAAAAGAACRPAAPSPACRRELAPGRLLPLPWTP